MVKDFNWPSSSNSIPSWPFPTIIFIVIFLPLAILVEPYINLEVPISLPPNDTEENEVKPPWPSGLNVTNLVSKEEYPLPKDGNPLNVEKMTCPLASSGTLFQKKSPQKGLQRSQIKMGSFQQKKISWRHHLGYRMWSQTQMDCQNDFHFLHHQLILLCHICHRCTIFQHLTAPHMPQPLVLIFSLFLLYSQECNLGATSVPVFIMFF